MQGELAESNEVRRKSTYIIMKKYSWKWLQIYESGQLFLKKVTNKNAQKLGECGGGQARSPAL